VASYGTNNSISPIHSLTLPFLSFPTTTTTTKKSRLHLQVGFPPTFSLFQGKVSAPPNLPRKPTSDAGTVMPSLKTHRFWSASLVQLSSLLITLLITSKYLACKVHPVNFFPAFKVNFGFGFCILLARFYSFEWGF
jgi:hypothetical protein